jgi:hypothetical protein
MSSQINTSESILKINENNDKTQNLGNEASLNEQSGNGVDLLKKSQSVAYTVFEAFEKMFPDEFQNEMSDYVKAPTEQSKIDVLNDYDSKNHIVNQPTRKPVNVEKVPQPQPVPEPDYKLMYKDEICTFFIGSVSIISLYIVFNFLQDK